MSGHTIAEFAYMLASAGVTYLVAWGAAWSYPQGAATIWPIGWVSIAVVIGVGLKSVLDSWRADRPHPSQGADD
ncbi:MAG: hypothetical protein JSR79_11570 [Proteobacteria bacterium]|nr:hypothetical protein [Pseudomonadota bacterium]